MSSQAPSDFPETRPGSEKAAPSQETSERSPTTSLAHQDQNPSHHRSGGPTSPRPAGPSRDRQRSRSSSDEKESPGRTTRHQRARSDEGVSDNSNEETERRDSLPERRQISGNLDGPPGTSAGPVRRPRQPKRQQSMPLLRLTRALSSSSTSGNVSFERSTSSRPPPSFSSTGDVLREGVGSDAPSISPSWDYFQHRASSFDWRASSRPATSAPTPSPTSSSSIAQPNPESRPPIPPVVRSPRKGPRAQILGLDVERSASRPRSHSLGTALLQGERDRPVGDRGNVSRVREGVPSNVSISDSTSSMTSTASRPPFAVPTVPPSGLRASPLQLPVASPSLVPSGMGMATQESQSVSPTNPLGVGSSSIPSPTDRAFVAPGSNFTKGFSLVKDGKRYKLVVVQHPVRARMCGFGDKNRRPLSPAPVVKLLVFSEATGEELDPTETQTSLFVVTAELRQPDGSPLESSLSEAATSQLPRRSIGSIASASVSSPPTSSHPTSPLISPSVTSSITGIPAISRNSSQSPLEPISVSTSRARSSSDALFPSLTTATSNAGGSQSDQITRNTRARSGTVMNPSNRFGLLRSGSAAAGLSVSSSRSLGPSIEEPTSSKSPSPSPSTLATSESAPVGGLAALARGSEERRRNSAEEADSRAPTTFMRNLVGVTVASANVLRDEHDQTGIFFALHDVSVRLEGVYCLKLTMTDLRLAGRVNEGVSHSLAETFTDPFTVYPPRRFPGMLEPTALSRKLASQGVKIPVRTDKKKKRRASDEEEEGEGDDAPDEDE